MARRKKSLSDFDQTLVSAGLFNAIANDKSTKPDDVELELPEGFSVESETKSKARVRDIGEVFTAKREVNAMLDLLGDVAYDPKARFLEPAAGNGNFLEEIVARKIKTVVSRNHKNIQDFEFDLIICLASTYAIDISDENVDECRSRLKTLVKSAYSDYKGTYKPSVAYWSAVDKILSTNIVLGDSLNASDKILFTEYTMPAPHKFTRRVFRLSDLESTTGLFATRPKPLTIEKSLHYLELGL
jgi:hypothetical protein